MRTPYLLFLFTVLFFALVFNSCKQKDNPKAVIKVVETIEGTTVPVYGALVEIGPSTSENILDEVHSSGYTNSSGVIEFEFDTKLILTAKASKIKRDVNGNIIYKRNGQYTITKTNSKMITLDYDFTDSKTIIVE